MKCRDCGEEVGDGGFAVRCWRCAKKNTEKRKYKRRHEHRQKMRK